MAVPSKAKQVEAIVDLLDDDEDRSLTDIATDIISRIYEDWQADITTPSPPLVVGLRFKVPWSATIYRVAWIGMGSVWVTDAGAKYGTLSPYDSDLWRVVKPSTSKAEFKGNADGHKPGDVLSHSQGQHTYEVLAVGEKCVLMKAEGLFVDTNETIKQFYKRESS